MSENTLKLWEIGNEKDDSNLQQTYLTEMSPSPPNLIPASSEIHRDAKEKLNTHEYKFVIDLSLPPMHDISEIFAAWTSGAVSQGLANVT